MSPIARQRPVVGAGADDDEGARSGAGAIRSAPPWPRSLAALVRHGLRQQLRAVLAWGIGFGAFGALVAAIWPSIEGLMTEFVKSAPAGLKEAFGIAELDTLERYIDAELLSVIMPIGLAFFAVRCIAQATVGAEDRGHLDTLLSLPVARRMVVIAAFVVTGLALAAILGLAWALTWIAALVAGSGASTTTLAAGFANVWPLAMAFAGLAALLAGLAHRPPAVTYGASAVLVAMYAIDLVGKLAPAVDSLRTISAFRYYGSAVHNGLDAGHIAGLTLGALVLTAIGAVLFERRDVL